MIKFLNRLLFVFFHNALYVGIVDYDDDGDDDDYDDDDDDDDDDCFVMSL